jgi:hypothetical protein
MFKLRQHLCDGSEVVFPLLADKARTVSIRIVVPFIEGTFYRLGVVSDKALKHW